MRRLVRSATKPGTAVLIAAAMAVGGWTAPERADDCQSLEDCYGYEEMDTFLALAWGLVNDFIQDRYAPRLFLVRLQYVPHGESGAEGCSEASGAVAEYNDMSYEYCAPDKTIYIGQDLLWTFYSEIGDAAAVMGLAHEYGHFMQDTQGVPPPATAAESIPHENQADCFAGAWFEYAQSVGIVEADDLEDLTQMLDFIGSSESDENRDHGTTAERTHSVNRGIAGGIENCNAFFPDTPLRSEADVEYWRRLWARLKEAAGADG